VPLVAVLRDGRRRVDHPCVDEDEPVGMLERLDHSRTLAQARLRWLSRAGDIYTDWDIDQLTDTLREMLEEAES
jgi:hypothetical protein